MKKLLHAGHTPAMHRSDNDVQHYMAWVVIALMYLVLFATLYLIWYKANPLWWA